MHGNNFMNSRYIRESIVDGVLIIFKTGFIHDDEDYEHYKEIKD